MFQSITVKKSLNFSSHEFYIVKFQEKLISPQETQVFLLKISILKV